MLKSNATFEYHFISVLRVYKPALAPTSNLSAFSTTRTWHVSVFITHAQKKCYHAINNFCTPCWKIIFSILFGASHHKMNPGGHKMKRYIIGNSLDIYGQTRKTIHGSGQRHRMRNLLIHFYCQSLYPGMIFAMLDSFYDNMLHFSTHYVC